MTDEHPRRSGARLMAGVTLMAGTVLACQDGPAGPEPASVAPMTVAAAGPAVKSGPRGAAVLAAVRASTARYHDVDAAVADGFAPGSPCVSAGPLGGMGIHYVSESRLFDAEVDPSATEVLLYEPTDSGLRLVGVEFMVVADVWDVVHSSAPRLMGATFDEHRGEARHGLPFDHYELHVWAWRNNPAGLTAPFNPKVACPAP